MAEAHNQPPSAPEERSDTGPAARVAEGCVALWAAGLHDHIWGHVSERASDGSTTWIKASGIGLEEVGVSDVLRIDSGGAVLEGTGRVPAEFPLHTELLAARPDIGSVVHAHPEACLALMALGVPVLPISHEAPQFVDPDIPVFSHTSNLVATRELGVRLAEYLGDHHTILMPGHGITSTGPDVATAVIRAIALERACRIQLLAAAAGEVVPTVPAAEVSTKRDECWSPRQISSIWAYLNRRAPN